MFLIQKKQTRHFRKQNYLGSVVEIANSYILPEAWLNEQCFSLLPISLSSTKDVRSSLMVRQRLLVGNIEKVS